jgi:hypothetical protein
MITLLGSGDPAERADARQLAHHAPSAVQVAELQLDHQRCDGGEQRGRHERGQRGE